MKTESYMLETAMRIANEGENSRVAFFFPTWQQAKLAAKTVLDNITLYDGATFKHATMCYTAKDGGTLRLIAIPVKEDAWQVLGGMQMSHAFHIDMYALQDALYHRIRSSKEHKTPMGLYGPYGVQRTLMDY
jgi:hypothetical protein